MKSMERNLAARLSRSQAERLLVELANLEEHGFERFINRYGNLVPSQDEPPRPQHDRFEEIKRTWNAVVGMDWREMGIRELRNLLRRAWKEPDVRTKDYLLFLLQQRD